MHVHVYALKRLLSNTIRDALRFHVKQYRLSASQLSGDVQPLITFVFALCRTAELYILFHLYLLWN